jgi:hypothetical protein
MATRSALKRAASTTTWKTPESGNVPSNRPLVFPSLRLTGTTSLVSGRHHHRTVRQPPHLGMATLSSTRDLIN